MHEGFMQECLLQRQGARQCRTVHTHGCSSAIIPTAVERSVVVLLLCVAVEMLLY